ncbi:MAG TPA: glycosyl hydrolase [Vicinamibacteria bacterium]|nr:glycosyl hydrolase [Vicinamibacteria bacterium]
MRHLAPAAFALALLAPPLHAQSRRAAPPSPRPSAAPLVAAAGLKSLVARSIGPAVMGGRISDIALDPSDPRTFYVALATGGLMKTTDNGGSFQGVTEREAVASMGAVAVAPSNAKVVWLGTGEGNDRNSSGWGNGVHRSTDGGATWTHSGLPASKAIARIAVHPSDPETAWVAAVGDLWNASPERGLYKTTDGGKTWKAILTAPAPYGDRVGSGDVVVDPSNPQILYATLYARRRTPWSFTAGPAATDGKDLGGIFKTTDGGATWRKLTGGLPGGTGRIGLAIHAALPRIVYAIVQSDEAGTSSIDEVRSRKGGVFRSEDGGETWTRTSPLNPRPFYFSKIRVDPTDDKRVYVLGFSLHVSDDGGRSFREDLFEKVHPDNHALAIDPRDPRRLLLGTDGGLYQSFERGKGWQHVTTMAAGEFYRINVDQGTPYRICGGLQDNLNWVGPSRTRTKDGIVNADWINLGGGDGFYCVFDPSEPALLYTESQQGYVHRMDLRSGQVKNLRPEAAEGSPAFRFHWNTPLIGSRHDPEVLYLAGNRVFELRGRGEQWRLISPELSTPEPARTAAVGSGAENYGVVYALAESPVAKRLLWAGTDDGRLWVTENGGTSWTDLSAQLPAAVRGQWISGVEPGHADAKVAYLAVSAYRSGDYRPLVYRSADMGRTWQSIASNLPAEGPVEVVREDPKNPQVLYVGTEFGLFVSFDRGAHWAELGGLPTVAVDDIVIHPREHDLVAATHGRSLYVLDDASPLAAVTPEVVARDAHLFAPRPALGIHLLPGFEEWAGTSGVFRGANPPEGAILTYWVKEDSGEPVKISVEAPGGRPVANLTGPSRAGLNRVTWDLMPTKDLLVQYGGEGRLVVPAGEYKVTLSYGKARSEQTLKVEVAPGVETR